MKDYDFKDTTALDIQIINFVKKGYIDEDNFFNKLATSVDVVASIMASEDYRSAWSLYTNSFDDNEIEFVNNLLQKFITNMKYLSIMDLESVVIILRQLSHDQQANDLIDNYIIKNNNINESDVGFGLYKRIKDKYLLDKLNEALRSRKRTETLPEVIKKLSNQNGWDKEDLEVMSRSTSDEYHEFFKSEKAGELHNYVITCLKFEDLKGEAFDAITLAVKGALSKIYSESTLNKIRLQNLYNFPPETE